MRQPSRTSLFAAAKRWDEPEVASTLARAPELVSASDPKGRTVLHLACAVKPGSSQLGEAHGLKTVATLLGAGADLEDEVPMEGDEGDFRATPLWYAVARGENLPLVDFLVKLGANASYSLWAAVWRDDEKMCQTLLTAKPKLDLRVHGETPIFYAARLKRLKTLNLLIEAGADSSIADFKGRDAVDIARARRLPEQLINRLDGLRNTRPK
ncbi:ankyrin repeat domain-containing protein [Variovorax sp. J31P207]|uniref:ankyrin repeat domain-containing protein n=1 Tax=Variovorax sp. J31P207 TaxID=3053510 RepID=UPI002578E72B|nr:ankyrin repeat domain-containing protein [Variovorax sp. J31P207]MDM0069619.1 ankyrin repeat domain-containing protein [Variovorax sp. J31P207]